MKYKLTSYELFAIAVAAFLVDHVGLYFYDTEMWLRVFRMFGLVWFIPAGYNAGRKSDIWMWQGTAVLAALARVTGFEVFPLCALATIIVIRHFVDAVGEFAIREKTMFWLVNLLLVVLIPITCKFCEYGSLAFILGLAGWLLKNRDRVEGRIVGLKFYFGYVTALYLAYTFITFPFNLAQMAFVTATTLPTAVMMYHFRDLLMNTVRRKNPDAVSRLCRFIGHKSLQIYVLQIMIMQIMFVV